MFTDTEFMTASEKKLVLKDWKTFLKRGLKRKHFTKRLYEHLHLNCGYIAHYNILGFYSTYFEAGQDTERFFEHLCNDVYGSDGCHDLNTAMIEVFEEFKDKIMARVEDNIQDKLDMLEACVKHARDDEHFAREFLSNIRI